MTKTVAIIKPLTKKRSGGKVVMMEGRVQAGFATWAQDRVEKSLSLDDYLIEHATTTFLVRVAGDSMIEAGILPDDVLVVDKSLVASKGKIVVAVVDGELMVKRYTQNKAGQWVLRAENPKYPAIVIPEGAQVQIWGVVTGVVRKY